MPTHTLAQRQHFHDALVGALLAGATHDAHRISRTIGHIDALDWPNPPDLIATHYAQQAHDQSAEAADRIQHRNPPQWADKAKPKATTAYALWKALDDLNRT